MAAGSNATAVARRRLPAVAAGRARCCRAGRGQAASAGPLRPWQGSVFMLATGR